VLEFLERYRVDERVRSISLPLICTYIQRSLEVGELTHWTVAVRGLEDLDTSLGQADWALPTGPVAQISRSRLSDVESVGVITSPGDEQCGLSPDKLEEARALIERARLEGKVKSRNVAAREVRPPTDGLLLLYPISRFSSPKFERNSKGRRVAI